MMGETSSAREVCVTDVPMPWAWLNPVGFSKLALKTLSGELQRESETQFERRFVAE